MLQSQGQTNTQKYSLPDSICIQFAPSEKEEEKEVNADFGLARKFAPFATLSLDKYLIDRGEKKSFLQDPLLHKRCW